MVNRTIRNFEIKELIATGGMAAIYKAVQVSLDRIVAIKILHGHLAQDTNFITRFEREAKAAANLKHENIVNIIDFGKAEDVYFIAMEYVEGRSLKDIIASVKFVPCDIAMAICLDIGKGLWHAHQKGVVHRDIKPANILIGYDGSVKIADFGLAQAQDLTSVTITGSIVGTPAYMSPEQAGGKKVDFRTDIFSMGVVIYEMLTGSKPFKGENYSSVIHEILTVKPLPALEANPLVPKEVNDIIEKMLDKDTEQRWQNCSALNDAIVTYSKNRNVEVTHAQIGAFIESPDAHFKNLVQERKEKHFERGVYFMNLTHPKVDDAISEFSKVLHLDPDDARAQKYLAELKKKRERVAPKKIEKKAVSPKKGVLLPIAITIGVLVVCFVFILALRRFRRTRVAAKDTTTAFAVCDVGSVPDGASITFDGRELNVTTPARIDSLAIGQHVLQLKKSGYLLYTDTMNAQKGDSLKIVATLVEEKKQVAYGSVVVRSTPPVGTVFLDNVNMKLQTPCTLEKVPEGAHVIKVIKKGYVPAEVNRKVEAGTQVEVSMVLEKREDKPSPQRTAYLKVQVEPWAKIYIDNRYIETTPIAGAVEVSAGSHVVKLENPSFKVWQKKVEFAPGQTVTLTVTLEPHEGSLKLTVKPWADVYIDGKFCETTPIAKPIRLSAGKHVLKLINPSFKPFTQDIEIPANKMLKKHVDLEPK